MLRLLLQPNTNSVVLGLVSVLLFGLRHGIDYDHIAAIMDLTTSTSDKPRKAMLLGLLYALGHGVVILLLGVLAIGFRQYLPEGVDEVMERFVGVTLIGLALYVIYSLIRKRSHSHFQLESRWMLLARLVRESVNQTLNLFRKEKKVLSPMTYEGRSAFVIGMIHGIGAETPTQLGLFLFAAGVGGKMLGMLGVLVFVTGLLITNTLMCAISVGMFNVSWNKDRLFRGLAAVTAVYSITVGAIMVSGAASVLP